MQRAVRVEAFRNLAAADRARGGGGAGEICSSVGTRHRVLQLQQDWMDRPTKSPVAAAGGSMGGSPDAVEARLWTVHKFGGRSTTFSQMFSKRKR